MDGPGTGAGHANQQQSKVQVSRGRYIRSPGAAGPGGRHLKLQLGKVLCHDISHNGGPPEYQLDVVSSVSSARRENTEGGCGPAGRRAHQYCFVFICQRQRPPKTEAPA